MSIVTVRHGFQAAHIVVSREKGVLYARAISRFFDVKIVNRGLREVVIEKIARDLVRHRSIRSTMNSSGGDLTLATLLLSWLARVIFIIRMILCMLKLELDRKSVV